MNTSFSDLEVEKQAELLKWLVEIGDFLAEKFSIHASINIHNSFIEPNTGRETFIKIISQAKTPMTFEFTETFKMPPADVSNAILRKVRELGHRSGLDDFGTGLNGMSLLINYDFDVIKLDRILTLNVETSEKKAKVLSLIFEMLTVLDKQHVVEGVETEEVFKKLKQIGFTTFQGFYFSKPIPVSEFVKAKESEKTHEISN